MAYGLRVVNDDLKIQIDSTYVNFALWEHGENVSTVFQPATGQYLATITFSNASAEPSLVAIKPPSDRYVGWYRYTLSNGNYNGFEVYSDVTGVGTFDWMAFVPRKDKSAEDYGLRVYDASEVLCFDSGYAPMIISDVDTCLPAHTAVVNVEHPSDSDAYFIMMPWGLWLRIVGVGGWQHHTRHQAMMKYVNATTLSFGGRPFFDVTIPGGDTDIDIGYWPDPWTVITVKKAF